MEITNIKTIGSTRPDRVLIKNGILKGGNRYEVSTIGRQSCIKTVSC